MSNAVTNSTTATLAGLVFFIAKLYQLLVTSLTAKNHFQPDKITRPWFLIYVFNKFVKFIQNKLQ